MTTNRKRFFNPTKRAMGNVPSLFRGWEEWKEGDYVVGELHSKFETTFRGKTSNNYRVKVLDCNFTVTVKKEGKTVNPIGQILVLNSAGQLNKFMDGTEKESGVEIGMIIDIEYAGKKVGQDDVEYHTFSRREAGYPDETENSDASTDDAAKAL